MSKANRIIIYQNVNCESLGRTSANDFYLLYIFHRFLCELSDLLFPLKVEWGLGHFSEFVLGL